MQRLKVEGVIQHDGSNRNVKKGEVWLRSYLYVEVIITIVSSLNVSDKNLMRPFETLNDHSCLKMFHFFLRNTPNK